MRLSATSRRVGRERREHASSAPWAGDAQGRQRAQPAIILNVQRQPGANVIATVDAIKDAAARAAGRVAGARCGVDVLADRTTGIRASVGHVEMELVLAVVLVVLVIFAFLRSLRATVIASIAVPISLIGTFGAMYLLGYSLNNLSLMALTIATGFVVDDAIVMIENISRYIEKPAKPPSARALDGCDADRLHDRLADGLAGRGADPAALHGRRRRAPVPRVRRDAGDHDPHLGRRLADAGADDVGTLAQGAGSDEDGAGGASARIQRFFDRVMPRYDRGARLGDRHQALTLLVALATLVLTVLLYIAIPRACSRRRTPASCRRASQAAQDVSYDRMAELQQRRRPSDPRRPDVASLSSSSASMPPTTRCSTPAAC